MRVTPDHSTNDVLLGHERVLVVAALSLLPVTALVGAASGTDVVAATRRVAAVHVHAGSIGWTALAVLAFAGPIVRVSATMANAAVNEWWIRASAWVSVVAAGALVVSMGADLAAVEAASGAALGLAVAASTVLLVCRVRPSTWTTPTLGIVAALVVFLAGSTTGALAAAHGNGDGPVVTGRALAAHAALLTVPYIVLATAAIVEWALYDDESRVAATTSGTLQVGFAVLSAVALLAGNLNGSLALIQANVPLLLSSIAIFVLRVGPRVFEAGWLACADRMWLGIGVAALAVDAGLFLHLLFEVGARRYSSIELVPDWVIFAVDHVSLVIVMTAALLGAIAATNFESRVVRTGDRVAAGATVFGAVGAVAGLGWAIDVLRDIGMATFGAALILAAAVALRRVLGQVVSARAL